MSYVKLALIALQIVQYFIKEAERNKAIDEGERRQIAKATLGVNRAAGISRQIEEETAKMTPEQILRDLQDNGELRD